MEEILIVGLCIATNALLAAVEMAFVAVGKPHLRELAKSGNLDAQKILTLREKPERTLSIVQIGITLVGALGAAVGGAGAEEWLSPLIQNKYDVTENAAEALGILLIILPITYLSVVVGELVPKTLAFRNPLGIVLRSAKWLTLFDKILWPLVLALEWSTKRILNFFIRRSKMVSAKPATPATDLTEQLDELSAQHKQYVLNLVNIEKKRIRDVMVPWKQVNHIDVTQSAEEVENVVLGSGHTRLPVVKDGVVIGLLHTKEFIYMRKTGKEEWTSILRPILKVQEGESILKALKIMQEKRSHLAVVYAQAQLNGIVTLEDIIEEIIGEIFDEDDDESLRKIRSLSLRFKAAASTDAEEEEEN